MCDFLFVGVQGSSGPPWALVQTAGEASENLPLAGYKSLDFRSPKPLQDRQSPTSSQQGLPLGRAIAPEGPAGRGDK
jgi:hypothetical protein